MDDAVRNRLLTLARRAVEAEVQGLPAPPIEPDWPPLAHAGAFVTLRTDRRLRGCIGTFQPAGILPQTVQDMAGEACHDPRFVHCPVTREELPQLRIEISVLSPLERALDPCALQVGKHGIYIRRGHRVGCFLPQVATEMGWDAETFLCECCAGKAGMAADAWRDPQTEVYLFTSECFSECECEFENRDGRALA
jgi:AmmeMemoRadiSam system protein A